MPPNSSITFPASLAKKLCSVCENLVLLGGLLSQITTCFVVIVVTNPRYMHSSHTKLSNWGLVLIGILCTTTGVDGVSRSIKKMVELVFSSFWIYISLSQRELHFTLG
jgi:hypothetical protein